MAAPTIFDVARRAGVSKPTVSTFSEADGYEATRRLLSLQPRPTALIVTDTALQTGCLRALQEAHLRIPEHCSLVGVANALPGSAGPAITAVVQPVADLAAGAAQLLLQLIAGERPAARHRVLQPLFVAGPSTAPPPRPSATGSAFSGGLVLTRSL